MTPSRTVALAWMLVLAACGSAATDPTVTSTTAIDPPPTMLPSTTVSTPIRSMSTAPTATTSTTSTTAAPAGPLVLLDTQPIIRGNLYTRSDEHLCVRSGGAGTPVTGPSNA